MKFIKENTKQSGITLIALVVTIVVLLILAGITINMLFSENGIITKAREATDKTAKAEENELTGMQNIAEKINDLIANINSADNEKTKISRVRFFEQPYKDLDYDCLYYNTVTIVPKGGYVNGYDYYIQEILNDAQRERMVYDIFYFLAGGTEGVYQLLAELKQNNTNIIEMCETQGTSVGDLIYELIMENDWLGAVAGIYALAVVEAPQQDINNEIIECWNVEKDAELTSLNQVLSAIRGETITVEQLAAEYDCSENIIVDLMYLSTVLNASKFETSILNSTYVQNMETRMDEAYTNRKDNAKEMIVKLPDGTEKTTKETIKYTISESGTYSIEVICDGETAEYIVEFTQIHNCPYTYDSEVNGHYIVHDYEKKNVEPHEYTQKYETYHQCYLCNYYEDHSDSDSDGICDICQYDMTTE